MFKLFFLCVLLLLPKARLIVQSGNKKQNYLIKKTLPVMENTQKSNWKKIAIGAAITFVVVVAAVAAYDKGVKPMLEPKKA